MRFTTRLYPPSVQKFSGTGSAGGMSGVQTNPRLRSFFEPALDVGTEAGLDAVAILHLQWALNAPFTQHRWLLVYTMTHGKNFSKVRLTGRVDAAHAHASRAAHRHWPCSVAQHLITKWEQPMNQLRFNLRC